MPTHAGVAEAPEVAPRLAAARARSAALRQLLATQQATLDELVGGGLSRIVVRAGETLKAIPSPGGDPVLDRAPDVAPGAEATGPLVGEEANAALLERMTERRAARLRVLEQHPAVTVARTLDRLVARSTMTAGAPAGRPQPEGPDPSPAGPPPTVRLNRPPTVRISIAARSLWAARRWGDLHLANDLASSFRSLGCSAVVAPGTAGQGAEAAHDSATSITDLHLVLRGQAPVRPQPAGCSILWVISHPETIDPEECDAYDIVLVASEQLAADLAPRVEPPVHVLHQATNERRFYRRRPVEQYVDPVAIVANARHVMRPIAADAVAAGMSPAIWGWGWNGMVPDELLRSPEVPNDELPAMYSSIGVLLADHWSTMRAWGFPSNRLFDALACGTAVISDDLHAVGDLFGDSVPRYRSPGHLAELVARDLADERVRRARVEEGRRIVLAAHTTTRRAATLAALAEIGG